MDVTTAARGEEQALSRSLGRLAVKYLGAHQESRWLKGTMATMWEPVIVTDPEIMSGTPCFRGARVPFQNLIDYLEGGHPLGEFLRQFPSVTRDMAIRALEEAKDSLLARIP